MSQNVPPWLAGLDEAWTMPVEVLTPDTININESIDSLRRQKSNSTLNHRPGSLSTQGTQKSRSQMSTAKRRNPLATLDSNEANTFRGQHRSVKLTGARSVSELSDGAAAEYGTVAQRSKSASPTKASETLEWKRRLVHGKLGYGDQTDLFGPSALENIFARSKGAVREAPISQKPMSWLSMKKETIMPSSPPPWPSLANQQIQERDESIGEGSDDGSEELELLDSDEDGSDRKHNSFRSNPFDLHVTDEDRRSAEHDNPAHSLHQNDHQSQDHPVGNRTISGQTELEGFSPVFVSKQTSTNGKVAYAAVDSHLIRAWQTKSTQTEKADADLSQDPPLPLQTTPQRKEQEVSGFTDGPTVNESLATVPDLSLSENLPTGTPELVGLGSHVEMQRGGYSTNGSFKRRPLSPSPLKLETTTADFESPGLQTSYFGANTTARLQAKNAGHDTPLNPETPSPSKTRSSGSPLKLFGPHDTFTSNRLLRRISQLDPEAAQQANAQSHVVESVSVSSPPQGGWSAIQNSFGNGELDAHAFEAEITITSASDDSRDASDRSPRSDMPPPGSVDPARFKVVTPPNTHTGGNKRKLSKHSAHSLKGSAVDIAVAPQGLRLATVEDATDIDIGRPRTDVERGTFADGKRPPPSPFRNPTPKRRRTLHAFETAMEKDVSHRSSVIEVPMKSEPNAEKDRHVNADNGSVSQATVARPRNPTPSQRRNSDLDEDIERAAEEFAARQPERVKAFVERFEASFHSDGSEYMQEHLHEVATEVAEFTFRVNKASGQYAERKPSFTTQDFTAEAIKVMNALRAKNGQTSVLASVNEAEADDSHSSVQSGRDTPSMRSISNASSPAQDFRTNVSPTLEVKHNIPLRIASGLRRFQETEDTLYMPESEASLQVDKVCEDLPASPGGDEYSNIRITVPSGEQRQCLDDSDHKRPLSRSSQSSQHSNGPSTCKTMNTGSTRKADNLGTLAPDAVGHLIGEDCGVMSFDKERNCWVRAKRPSPSGNGNGFLEPPSQLSASDDDPLREISDLPVDEQLERRRISSPTKITSDQISEKSEAPTNTQLKREPEARLSMNGRTTSEDTIIARPVTRDGVGTADALRRVHSSSAPSKYTFFGSSQQNDAGTRATSWGTEELCRPSVQGLNGQDTTTPATLRSNAPSGDDYALSEVLDSPREVEVEPSKTAFTAPPEQRIASGMAKLSVNDTAPQGCPQSAATEDILIRNKESLPVGESTIESLPSPHQDKTPLRSYFPPSSVQRSNAKSYQARKHTLPFSLQQKMHEASELSFVAPLAGQRMMSVSVSVSKPLVARRSCLGAMTHAPSSPLKDPNSTFLLSDLPDFTVREEEEDRPSEKELMSRLTQHATAQVDDRYALSRSSVVRAITDEHEAEPYWEDLTVLDLRSRSLAALVGLEDFCTALQDLNVSGNLLTDLAGAPISTRRLLASDNRLDSLTDWSRLLNLQFLDVSNNQIDALDALACLIHLRELRIDNNQLTSLDGIFGLDALLSIRLRGNRIQKVTFSNCRFQRLTHLDLSGNHINHIERLECLTNLQSLKLDGNDLANGLNISETITSLRELSVKDCGLLSLNVTHLPNLRKLNVDGNKLAKISGLSTLKHLDVLSMQRQRLEKGTAIALFDERFDARTVRLSHNYIPSLHLKHLSLRTEHLEMVAVGLQELPADFATKMGNLRTLNLNFNFLQDIKPLLGAQLLYHLSLCGNKIDRLRKTAAVLSKLPSLNSLDLRDNLVTHGFYAPQVLSNSKAVNVLPWRDEIHSDPTDDFEHEETTGLTLPTRCDVNDQLHQGRLDEETRLRRRVYELLFANSCESLESLDGAVFEKDAALAKDWVWRRLVKLGIVRKLDANTGNS